MWPTILGAGAFSEFIRFGALAQHEYWLLVKIEICEHCEHCEHCGIVGPPSVPSWEWHPGIDARAFREVHREMCANTEALAMLRKFVASLAHAAPQHHKTRRHSRCAAARHFLHASPLRPQLAQSIQRFLSTMRLSGSGRAADQRNARARAACARGS